MARPEIDLEAGRKKIMAIADEVIRSRGAVSFTMADLANVAGMSPSNLYRYFENKDALAEAMAGEWFAELIAIMEELVATDLPIEEKLFQFFARRLMVKRQRYEADPELFASYMELGDEHFEVIRGYVDLCDHYMAIILAEAMDAGYFAGMELDDVVSIVNTMIQPFVNPHLMMQMMHLADEQRLAIVVNTMLHGLSAKCAQRPSVRLHIAS